MKKLAALFALLLILPLLCACGGTKTAPEGGTRSLPGDAGDYPEPVDWDLTFCQPEEAYREVEHYNIDPTGYKGMSLRLMGEFFSVQDHGKTFYYIGVRDEDGCVENLEIRFPGDGSLPEGFPEEGEVTVYGVLDYYSTQRDGKDVNCAVLTDTDLSRVHGDGRG